MTAKTKFTLSVGFNGVASDLSLILASRYLESVYSGGLANFVYGGRHQYAETVADLENCANLAHSKHVKYEVALNAPGNFPPKYDKEWWYDLCKYLVELERIGINRIIASHPFLIETVKNKTSMEVVASTICEIAEPRMASYYEEIGADIIIPSMNVNYKISKLQRIKSVLKKAKLRIMVNEHCLGDCPWRRFHHASYAHKHDELDYHMNCKRKVMRNPFLTITNNCIRPEDMHYYFDFCDNFKIVGRLVDINLLLKRIKAYEEQSFEGNYIELSDYALARSIYVNNKSLHSLFENRVQCSTECDSCEKCVELYKLAAKDPIL